MWFFSATLIALPFWTNCANILGIYFHAGKSHHILGEKLLKELARRGHNVTMASPFPLSEPFPNYTDINLTGILEDQLARESMFMKMNKGHGLIGIDDVLELTRAQTELTLNHTEMAKLLRSGTRFDVIIIDWFLNYSILMFGKLFGAPIVPVASHGTTPMVTIPLGSPLPPSYVTNMLVPMPGNMTFFQRVLNSLIALGFQYVGRCDYIYHEQLLRKYFENPPSLKELNDNIAVMLINAHYSFESPRPFVPTMIPVGGFHVEKPAKLPQDLQELMDNAEKGVIYFSLGTNMKSTLMPVEKQQQILRAFAKLPYTVFWKWEQEDMIDRPRNVVIRKWFPQNDVLAHRNLKLFISHGGLLSTIESIHHGVPVLGVPIFGDQKCNVPNAVRAGYALQLDLAELDEATLTAALDEILYNPSYKRNAMKRSRLLRDQPQSPMDTAVFWVEHVIRHKGGDHLKNAGVDLSWYQYFLLDVIAFVVVTFLIGLTITIWTVKRIYRLFFPAAKQKEKKH